MWKKCDGMRQCDAKYIIIKGEQDALLLFLSIAPIALYLYTRKLKFTAIEQTLIAELECRDDQQGHE